jgi:16S rRNA (guanine966-N2)-methyltransferase
MLYRIRIIGGDLRGRKLEVKLDPGLRPMSDRARESLFNILMHDIPNRPFFDIFAGSGAVGIEAISRGASQATFVEKDGLAVQSILLHAKTFGINDQVRVLQADAYRWIEKGAIPAEPANYFLGPPYMDLQNHAEAIAWVVTTLKNRVAPESKIVLQTDEDYDPKQLSDADQWDIRRYGRNQLTIWTQPAASAEPGDDAGVRAGGGEDTA